MPKKIDLSEHYDDDGLDLNGVTWTALRAQLGDNWLDTSKEERLAALSELAGVPVEEIPDDIIELSNLIIDQQEALDG